MAELSDDALLLRRIPYGETSLICQFLTAKHGRISLMVRGGRRPKSPFRAALSPLFMLHIHWYTGRTGMGTLVDIVRNGGLLGESKTLAGLELQALASRIFQEGESHGYAELYAGFKWLNERDEIIGLPSAVWMLLMDAGWLGEMSSCWHCGEKGAQMMYWHQAELLCGECGTGLEVSNGLRRSIEATLTGSYIRFSAQDLQCWKQMIGMTLKAHHIKVSDSFC